MDSRAYSNWMPFVALIQADMTLMLRSWIVRIWVGLTVIQVLITFPASLEVNQTASQALTEVLTAYPFIWSAFIIFISVGAVSSEAGVVADSILSKSVRRWQYIVARLLTRVLTVLLIFAAVVVPAIFLYANNMTNDLDTAGVMWGMSAMALLLTLTTALSITFSTIFNRTMVALVVMIVFWYFSSGLFAVLELEWLSSAELIIHMPETLQGERDTDILMQIVAAFGGLSLLTMLITISYFGNKDL